MQRLRRLLAGMSAMICVLACAGGATARAETSSPATPPVPPTTAGSCQPAAFVTVAFELPAGARIVSERDLPVCLTGSAIVSFHGSRAAGCGPHGLCEYAGTDIWRPKQGTLSVVGISVHGRRRTLQMFTVGSSPLAGVVTRRFGGRVAGTCRESSVPGFGFSTLRAVHDGRAALQLPGGGVDAWPSLCAGPLASDLPAFPPISLSLARALRGTAAATVDGSRSFARGGFAGTVADHLTVTTGRPANDGDGAPPTIHKRRFRSITLTYRVQWPLGLIAVDWQHPATGCTELDACGMAGRARLVVGEPASGQTLQVAAEAPASRPKQDLLAALGLSRRGDPKGVGVVGELRPRADVSTVTTGQHGADCRDGRSLDPMLLLISGSGGRLKARYGSLFDGDPLRTSCPGPALGLHALASATLAPGALAAPRLTLSLDHPQTYADRGYVVHSAPQLSLALTRERITQRVRELVVAHADRR